MIVFNRIVLELDDEFEYSFRFCYFIILYRNYCKCSFININYIGFIVYERSYVLLKYCLY